MWLTAGGIEVSPRDEMPKNPAVARVHDNNGADKEVHVHAIPARTHRDIRKAALPLPPSLSPSLPPIFPPTQVVDMSARRRVPGSREYDEAQNCVHGYQNQEGPAVVLPVYTGSEVKACTAASSDPLAHSAGHPCATCAHICREAPQRALWTLSPHRKSLTRWSAFFAACPAIGAARVRAEGETETASFPRQKRSADSFWGRV
jgi:hypothetical protein